MSRHSKWSKIKHFKGAADVKRGALFTKLARAVTVAAREGGGNPDFNFKLRLAIDQARAANMPKDSVERAVVRGGGAEGGAAAIEEVVYEGFGPGGVAILIESLTDSRNRTTANLKNIFRKHDASLGAAGSVRWMFERRGVARALGAPETRQVREELELALIDAGAIDLHFDEGEMVIATEPEQLERLKKFLAERGLKVDYAGLEWFPKERVQLEPEARPALVALLEALDDDEDVSDYYTNAIGSD